MIIVARKIDLFWGDMVQDERGQWWMGTSPGGMTREEYIEAINIIGAMRRGWMIERPAINTIQD
jgi:hypothetical protein